MFSAFNPSKCTHNWSSGQPARPGSSWEFGALLKGLTSVVDNSCWSRDSNPQPRVTSPTLYPLEPRLPIYIALELEPVNAVNRFHRKAEIKCAPNGSPWKPNTSMVAEEIA